jgi:hypothetical protein
VASQSNSGCSGSTYDECQASPSGAIAVLVLTAGGAVIGGVLGIGAGSVVGYERSDPSRPRKAKRSGRSTQLGWTMAPTLMKSAPDKRVPGITASAWF